MTSLRSIVDVVAKVLRGQATSHLELELHELEALFALLVVGSVVGLPTAPPAVSLRLLPHIAREVEVLLTRSSLGDDALSLLAGHLDIG
jgi:hypothetical protein